MFAFLILQMSFAKSCRRVYTTILACNSQKYLRCFIGSRSLQASEFLCKYKFWRKVLFASAYDDLGLSNEFRVIRTNLPSYVCSSMRCLLCPVAKSEWCAHLNWLEKLNVVLCACDNKRKCKLTNINPSNYVTFFKIFVLLDI